MIVLQAILGVMEDLAKVGVSKDRTNETQHFQYRGIDDVRDALAPCLVKNRLLIVPQIISREVTERQSKSGSALFYVLLTVNYEFVAVDDGSIKIIGPFYGEGMDSSDKATNKAMSAAYKYMAIDVFCIRTKGDAPDADATVHEVIPSAAKEEPTPQPLPEYAPPSIQSHWDGTKKVGFTRQFRGSHWHEVPDEFLTWALGEGLSKINSFQAECARLEKQRRDSLISELPKDLPENFFAGSAESPGESTGD